MDTAGRKYQGAAIKQKKQEVLGFLHWVDWKPPLLQELLSAILKTKQKKTSILDAGCG